MIQHFLTVWGDLFSTRYELGPGFFSLSYLITNRQSGTNHFLGILSPEISSRISDRDRFLQSLKECADIDSTFLQIDHSGVLPQESCYYLSSALPSDILPVHKYLEHDSSISNHISRIGAVCCHSLTALHNSGRVHGGLVPPSLLISKDSIYIGDAGVFIALHEAGIDPQRFQALETRYASPEQILTGRVTPQSDIYSLGAILYHFLTGKPPFGGRTTAALMASVLVDETVAGSLAAGQKPGHVASAILRAIEKSPPDRWTSAQQFEQALTRSSPSTGLQLPVSSKPRRAGCLSGIILFFIISICVSVGFVVTG